VRSPRKSDLMLKSRFYLFFVFCGLISTGVLGMEGVSLSWAAPDQCDLVFKKLKLCGMIHWKKSPRVVEMITPQDAAEMTIELKNLGNRKGELPKDLDLLVKPTMPSMGHGTEPTRVSRLHTESSQIVEKSDSLGFLVEDVFLSMPGEWSFLVRIKKNGRELDHSSWLYKLK